MKLFTVLLPIFLICSAFSFGQVQIDTFFYSGSSVTVNITSAMIIGPTTIDIRGGQGGDLSPGLGGNGGQVIADMNFTAGDVLTINVGKKGTDAVSSLATVFVGAGGTRANIGTVGGTAGSGGGASDIRLNGTTLSDRIFVAGGGGGCGGVLGASLNSWSGGSGGGLIGGDGTNANGFVNGGGKGGSQSSGGAVGFTAGLFCVGAATDGALGLGGVGSGDIIGGGGGGGGNYGGGGACFSGGGGGSSFADPSAINVVHSQGFQSGDGMIIITYSTCIAQNQTVSACDSLVSPSGDYTWTTTGIHADTINPLLSCLDSAILVNLTISNSSVSTESIDACDAYFWPVNNSAYSSSGQYSVLYQSSAGCDSTLILDLTIFTPITHTVTAEACDTYTWPINGQTYTASANNIWLTTGGPLGCDTSYNLHLTIHESTSNTEVITACNSYTWPVNGLTYITSAQVTESLTSAEGCDSIRILDLTINNVDVTVTEIGEDVLSANLTQAEYQWLDCEDDYSIIPGDTNQVFNIPGAGSYAVIVTVNGCSDTSTCISNSLGIHAFSQEGIDIYPNPFQNELHINLNQIHELIEVNIIDATGKLIQSNTFEKKQWLKIEFNGESGTYFIEVKTKSGLKLTKTIIMQ